MKCLILLICFLVSCANHPTKGKIAVVKEYNLMDGCGKLVTVQEEGVKLTGREIIQVITACENVSKCASYIHKFSDGQIDYACREFAPIINKTSKRL